MAESETSVAIVTGASSGIGRCTAQRLVEAGYRVVLAARTESKLNEAVEQIGSERAEPHPCDVTDAEQVEGLIEKTAEDHGRIDVLANVAGMVMSKPLAKCTQEDWQQMVDVNLTSVFTATRAVWPVFQKQKSGQIVNFSSMASKDPFPGFGIYATVKVGVNMLTMMTAQEGKRIGVRSVCLAPGAVETPMLRSIFSEKQVPADQALDPDELASIVRDCVTGERDYESGQTLFVNR